MDANSNNNTMGLNLMDPAALDRYLRTLNSATSSGLQFPVLPPPMSSSSTSNNSLPSPLSTIPLLPFVTTPNLFLDFAAMQQQQQQQQLMASKKQQEEERSTIQKNIQSWERQNGWKLSKIKTNDEATAEAKKLFSVILRTRSEKNMLEMPDRLYSSLKYEILIKLSRFFVKYELSSNTDLIFCRIEIVGSSDPSGPEILKDGEKLMKGIQDMTTMSVSKDKSAFETKLKFQYTTNSYNMDGQVFMMRLQFYDPSVSIETPLMVVHSTKFQIFARRPTMRQQGDEPEGEEVVEENQPQDTASAKKKAKTKAKSKKKKTGTTKKSTSSPKKSTRRSARLKARESDEEEDEEMEDEDIDDQLQSEDENEDQISDSEKKASPRKKLKTEENNKIIEIPDSPMTDSKSDALKDQQQNASNSLSSTNSLKDSKESSTPPSVKEEKISESTDTKMDLNSITTTSSNNVSNTFTSKQPTAPIPNLMNTAALLGFLQPNLFPGLSMPMNGLQNFTNCLQLLVQLKNTLPENEQGKAIQMIQEKLFNAPSTLSESEIKSLFK